MKGILILAHGSREKSTEETLAEIISMLKEDMKDCLIETAYLQFNEINLEVGLNKLVEQGAEDIKVIPYFLFDGIHIREDIPSEIEAYLADKKGIKIAMGKTLGADRRLSLILADRVREAL